MTPPQLTNALKSQASEVSTPSILFCSSVNLSIVS
jgi:hypothetical protein